METAPGRRRGRLGRRRRGPGPHGRLRRRTDAVALSHSSRETCEDAPQNSGHSIHGQEEVPRAKGMAGTEAGGSFEAFAIGQGSRVLATRCFWQNLEAWRKDDKGPVSVPFQEHSRHFARSRSPRTRWATRATAYFSRADVSDPKAFHTPACVEDRPVPLSQEAATFLCSRGICRGRPEKHRQLRGHWDHMPLEIPKRRMVPL